jgi:peptidoglycan hydrolase FlgJ
MIDEALALSQIAPASVASEKTTGVPALLTAAQCILESAWLTKCPGNNPFGIKAEPDQPSVLVWTHEEIDGQRTLQGLQFRAYDSLADAFADHARLFTSLEVYADAWAGFQMDGDVEEFTRAIAVHYATASNYATEVLAIMRQGNVVAAVAAARAA